MNVYTLFKTSSKHFIITYFITWLSHAHCRCSPPLTSSKKIVSLPSTPPACQLLRCSANSSVPLLLLPPSPATAFSACGALVVVFIGITARWGGRGYDSIQGEWERIGKNISTYWQPTTHTTHSSSNNSRGRLCSLRFTARFLCFVTAPIRR